MAMAADGYVMRYRDEGFKVFKFKLPLPNYSPIHIVSDLEAHLRQRYIVMCVVADLEGYITCTICGNTAIENLLSDDKILVANELCNYQLLENKWHRIRIRNPPSHLTLKDIDNVIRQYGRVIVSEFESKHRHRYYFAVIELRKPVPKEISLKRHMCTVFFEDCS